MVLAQGLGDADRQAPRHEEGYRCPGTPAGRDHAPHLWTGRALQGNSNGMVILVRANLSGLTWELVLRAIMVVRTHLIFLFGRPLWAIGASRSQVRWGDRCAIRFQITSQTRAGVFPQL